MKVDFHGAELEPFQLALLDSLGVLPVNYDQIGGVRAAARRRVARCLERGPRFQPDPLYERARRWLEHPHEGDNRFPPS